MGVAIHERFPITALGTWFLDKQRNRSLSDILDFITPAKQETPVALFDIPTGIYLWELMSAFPNNTVILTTRQVQCSNQYTKHIRTGHGPCCCRFRGAWRRAHRSRFVSPCCC